MYMCARDRERERETKISHFESVPVGVANSNNVHVEIIESVLLHTTLQHQCFSTRKVTREIEIEIIQ